MPSCSSSTTTTSSASLEPRAIVNVSARASVTVRAVVCTAEPYTRTRCCAKDVNGPGGCVPARAVRRWACGDRLVADGDVIGGIRQGERARVAGRTVEIHERDDLPWRDVLRQHQQQPHGALGDGLRSLV